MNTDVGDLLRSIRLPDRRVLYAAVSLVAALLIGLLGLQHLVTGWLRHGEVAAEHEAVLSSLHRLERVRAESPEELSRRMAEAQQRLEELTAAHPTAAQLAEELAQYYVYAEQEGVDLTRLEALVVPPEEEAAQAGYRPQHYLLSARGNPASLLRFVRRVATGPYAALFIDNLTLMPDLPSALHVDLLVYTSDPPALSAPDGGPQAARRVPWAPALVVRGP